MIHANQQIKSVIKRDEDNAYFMLFLKFYYESID